jgi:hypothetical protein
MGRYEVLVCMDHYGSLYAGDRRRCGVRKCARARASVRVCACVCVHACAGVCVRVRACEGYNLDNLVNAMKLGGTVPFKLPVLKSLRNDTTKSNDCDPCKALSVTHARLTVLATLRGSSATRREFP